MHWNWPPHIIITSAEEQPCIPNNYSTNCTDTHSMLRCCWPRSQGVGRQPLPAALPPHQAPPEHWGCPCHMRCRLLLHQALRPGPQPPSLSGSSPDQWPRQWHTWPGVGWCCCCWCQHSSREERGTAGRARQVEQANRQAAGRISVCLMPIGAAESS
jgi:hypothetical protein